MSPKYESHSPSTNGHRKKKKRSTSRSRSRTYSDSRSHSGSYSRSYTRSRSHSRGKKRHSRSRSFDRNNEEITPCKCIGVFGLSLYTRERDLKDIFSKYGTVEDVVIVYDHYTRRSRGFGFVYFSTVQEATYAKDKSTGLEIDGRRIRVDFSVTQRAHNPTPGVYMGKPGHQGRKRTPSPYYNKKRSYSRSRSPSYSSSYINHKCLYKSLFF